MGHIVKFIKLQGYLLGKKIMGVAYGGGRPRGWFGHPQIGRSATPRPNGGG
jgi:hypothetical protein